MLHQQILLLPADTINSDCKTNRSMTGCNCTEMKNGFTFIDI